MTYTRIVDDIRRRIDAGELRPGQQVPSARRITRDWGVAIATATKVHAALRQEGLVHVVPGVGTVVSTPVRKPLVERRAEVDRAAVVRAAIEIVDLEGMAALSMRRVATDLGVPTMTLYRHVRSKDELILYMIDHALGDEPFPAAGPTGWREGLEVEARLQWRLARRHRWLASAMSVTRPQPAPNALAHTDWALRALDGLGLDLSETMHIHVLVFSFVRGLATSLEAEAEAEQDSGLTSDEWMDTQFDTLTALAGAGGGPLATFLRAVGESSFELDLDTLFEFGLARLLDGLAAYLATRGST